MLSRLINWIEGLSKPTYRPMRGTELFSVQRLAMGEVYMNRFLARILAEHEHEWDPKTPEVRLLKEYFSKHRDHRMIDILSAQVLKGIDVNVVPDRFKKRVTYLKTLVN